MTPWFSLFNTLLAGSGSTKTHDSEQSQARTDSKRALSHSDILPVVASGDPCSDLSRLITRHTTVPFDTFSPARCQTPNLLHDKNKRCTFWLSWMIPCLGPTQLPSDSPCPATKPRLVRMARSHQGLRKVVQVPMEQSLPWHIRPPPPPHSHHALIPMKLRFCTSLLPESHLQRFLAYSYRNSGFTSHVRIEDCL